MTLEELLQSGRQPSSGTTKTAGTPPLQDSLMEEIEKLIKHGAASPPPAATPSGPPTPQVLDQLQKIAAAEHNLNVDQYLQVLDREAMYMAEKFAAYVTRNLAGTAAALAAAAPSVDKTAGVSDLCKTAEEVGYRDAAFHVDLIDNAIFRKTAVDKISAQFNREYREMLAGFVAR